MFLKENWWHFQLVFFGNKLTLFHRKRFSNCFCGGETGFLINETWWYYQPVLWQPKLGVFSRDPGTVPAVFLWKPKPSFSQEVRPSPAVFALTKLVVLQEDLVTFSAVFVATKCSFFSSYFTGSWIISSGDVESETNFISEEIEPSPAFFDA